MRPTRFHLLGRDLAPRLRAGPRLMSLPGLSLVLLTTLAGPGCSDGGGGNDEEPDAGPVDFAACDPGGFVCTDDGDCCSRICQDDGTCLATCEFSGQCDTGCCAPTGEPGSPRTCQPLDVCTDDTQATACDLLAQQTCRYARRDYVGAVPGCESNLAWGPEEAAVCETEWRAACCGALDDCDSAPTVATAEQVATCIRDLIEMPCPPEDGGAQIAAPCVADCYVESRCVNACETCVFGMGTLQDTTGGDARCILMSGPIVPNWSLPPSCEVVFADPEPPMDPGAG